MIPIDAQGKQYQVGQKVARASKFYRVDGLYVAIVKVTAIKDSKVYINDSVRPVKFPERMVIMS